jgi:uncharacterized membrane protein
MYNKKPLFSNSLMQRSRVSRPYLTLEAPMTRHTVLRSEWLIPAALLALALIPVVAGVARLGDLASGEASAATARFHASPLPVVIHVLSASWFALAGAFQFSPTLRRTRWHKWSGRSVVPMGLAAAFSSGMAVALVLGVTTILKGNIPAHKAWMLRAYAIGMGAGTQVFTHLPWFLLVGEPTGTPRAVMMIGAWVLNLAIAEWLIAKDKRRAGSFPTRRQSLKFS